MQTYFDKRALRMAFLCLAAGLGAGFVNGLAGTGAGVVFLLFWGLCGGGITKEAFSLAMACVLPLSVISLLTYGPPDTRILSMVPLLTISAVAGGLCGAWLQKKVKLTLLKWAFAGLVIWGGVHMLLK